MEIGLILSAIVFVVLIFLAYNLFNTIECPKCGHNMVGHSHTEKLNNVDIEVYRCKNCKSKYI